MPNGDPQRRPTGRQAQAAVNDERILRIARDVLLADPHATMSAVASEAGVGVASLYRRFPNRDELVRRLALDAMSQMTVVADAHRERLASDPWTVFVEFIAAAMKAGGGSMEAFAGTFDPGNTLNRAGQQLYEAIENVLERAQELGSVRRDIGALDLFQIFHMLRSVRLGTPDRDAALQRRYIDLLVPSLRSDRTNALSEPAPSWREQLQVWNR